MKRFAIGIVNRGAKVLLGKRSPGRAAYPGVWDLFGGHVEVGETMEAALVREFQEELGITPTNFVLLEMLSAADPAQYGPAEFFVFRVDAWIGAPANLLEEEHSEIRWFSFAEASTLTLGHPEYPRLFRRIETTPNQAPQPTALLGRGSS